MSVPCSRVFVMLAIIAASCCAKGCAMQNHLGDSSLPEPPPPRLVSWADYDGQHLVTASGPISLWDVSTGQMLQRFETREAEPLGLRNGLPPSVLAVALSPGGERIAAALGGVGDSGAFVKDSSVRVWDASTGEELLRLEGHTPGARELEFSPDGSRLLSAGSNTARMWDLSAGTLLFVIEHSTKRIEFSPDGGRFLGIVGRTATVFDALDGNEICSMASPDPRRVIRSAHFSADGTRVLAASSDNIARICDAQSGQVLTEFTGHTNYLQDASFAGERWIVTGGSDETVRVWSQASGETVRTIRMPGPVERVLVSPDGKRCLARWTSAEPAPVASLLDLESGSELVRLTERSDVVGLIGFGPTGEHVLIAGDRPRALLSADTGELIRRYER